MSDLKFIITADDYGVSPLIDLAIEKAIEEGLITSVAAFVNLRNENGEYRAEKAAKLKEKWGDRISLGLHFTIISGGRVGPNRTPLMRKNRQRQFKGFQNQPSRGVKEAHIREELRAQIKAFEASGLEIEHFSCHGAALTHVLKGLVPLLDVIHQYNNKKNEEGKPSVPLRNPMFIGTLVAENRHALGESFLTSGFMKGLISLKNAFRGKKQDILHTQAELLESIKKINRKNIPIPNFFIESMYGFDIARDRAKTLEAIFDPANYDKIASVCPDYVIDQPISNTFRTAEMMVHLGYGPVSGRKKANIKIQQYTKHLKDLGDYGGVDLEYLQFNRHEELEALRIFFKKHPEQKANLVTYKGNNNNVRLPA